MDATGVYKRCGGGGNNGVFLTDGIFEVRLYFPTESKAKKTKTRLSRPMKVVEKTFGRTKIDMILN